jgi:hypothetical protein
MISVWCTSGTRKRSGTGATRLSKPEIQYGEKEFIRKTMEEQIKSAANDSNP